MRIISCCKIVPDEQDLVVQADRTLSFDKAQWKIGQYDLNAIEEGVCLANLTGGIVTALTVGGRQADNSKIKKAILSRGPTALFAVADEALAMLDTHQTAQVLARAIRKIETPDLVLCGEGSSDLYAQQVGAQLGQLLGVTALNAVSKITPQGDRVTVERSLEDGIEVLEVPLPAVISVTSDINIPRLPTMKDILAANKRPVTTWALADVCGDEELHGSTHTIATLAIEEADRKQILLEGEDAVQKLCDYIRKEMQ